MAACTKQAAPHISPSTFHLPEIDTNTRADATLPDLLEEVETERIVPASIPLASAKPTTLVNLMVHDAPVQEVLLTLAKEGGVNMDIHPDLHGNITIHAIQQSIPAILLRIAKQIDLQYEWVNGVWMIAPDAPVIRSYRVGYVNQSRDTVGYIGAASEIGGTGRSAAGANTTGNPNNAQGNTNSSRTSVSSQSRYHLWESVVRNIQELLEVTDHLSAIEVADTKPEKLAMSDKLTDSDEKTPQVGSAILQSNAINSTPPLMKNKTASRVIANPEAGVLTIRASKRQHQQVRAYLRTVMQIVTRQVLIEATIVEVELAKSYQMGIDWARLSNAAQQRGWSVAQSFGNKAARFNSETGAWEANNSKNALGQNNGNVALLLTYLNPFSRLGNLSASVTLLEQFGKTRVLSSPKLMVLNNQTAMLKVVDNLVYFTIQSQISQSSSTNGANLQSVTTTANTVPVGLVMAVTAQINSQRKVNLSVRPTVSRVLRYIEDPNPQLVTGTGRIVSSIPEIQVREMESVLNIASGHVAILGGLMQEDGRDLIDSVPGVSALPVIGHAFRGKNQASKKTELVVFLRPTVIGIADVNAGDLQVFQSLLPEGGSGEQGTDEAGQRQHGDD
ncbi:type II secretion system protein GspD [Methylophilus aquaticus]|uniref:Type II/III secretion system secretin-like domain-containing protein n=1 Tax=Methylophilus aquaticus TaxID=1971610 RepID=A0ABT9JUR8_9PROT|nr:hypothetical protein [Methylophilus aquaticus]MDP8567866.1 hypothetical protein [Methylophilus aquaticus]